MRRRFFAVVSAVSLLLCLATVGLWVRSIDNVDWIGHVNASGQGYGVGLADGRIILRSYRYTKHWNRFIGWRTYPQLSQLLRLDFEISIWERYGVWWTPTDLSEANGAHSDGLMIVVNCWIGCILTTILPTVFILKRIRRRRGNKGSCPTCGYDLTGNTSGVCPECGTPVAKEPAEKSPRPA
jgi:hypothetical protein